MTALDPTTWTAEDRARYKAMMRAYWNGTPTPDATTTEPTMAVSRPVPAGVIVCPICGAPNPPTQQEDAGWRHVPYAWVCSDACEAAYRRVLDKIPVAEGFMGARGISPVWPGDLSASERIRQMRDEAQV